MKKLVLSLLVLSSVSALAIEVVGSANIDKNLRYDSDYATVVRTQTYENMLMNAGAKCGLDNVKEVKVRTMPAYKVLPTENANGQMEMVGDVTCK